MRTPLIPAVILAALALAARAAGPEECDLSGLERIRYCESCSKILGAGDILSGATYYACDDCRTASAAPGECSSCGKPLQKRTAGSHACRYCFADSVEAEACLKIYYECPGCAIRRSAPGECPDCGGGLLKKESRALVEYVCEACGAVAHVAGACAYKDCENHGKPLRRTCSMSGVFPHVKSE